MPFVFSSSLFFLVRGRSISNAALNFPSSFPCSAFPFFSSDCLRKFCESDNFRAEVFSMQRNIISLTVCTNLIEDSFAGASSFYTFETSSFSRSCTPFLFSSSLIFLIVVRGRSISSVALNFSTSFPGFSIFLA